MYIHAMVFISINILIKVLWFTVLIAWLFTLFSKQLYALAKIYVLKLLDQGNS